MQTVSSADGTRIAYDTDGAGPPLVLLHGSSVTGHSWGPIKPLLAEEFTLVVPHRRGRAASGDSEAYSLDREIADLRAVLDDIDGTPSVFAHSFGGLVALAGATELMLDRLVLYEPSVLVGDHRETDLAARIEERLASGDRADAMALFYREGAGIPDPEQLPVWPEGMHFDLVETVIRERRAEEEYELPETVDNDAETLLLTGERGPPPQADGVRVVADRLPESELVELDGVGHLGTQSAPEQVAAKVRPFCARRSERP